MTVFPVHDKVTHSSVVFMATLLQLGTLHFELVCFHMRQQTKSLDAIFTLATFCDPKSVQTAKSFCITLVTFCLSTTLLHCNFFAKLCLMQTITNEFKLCHTDFPMQEAWQNQMLMLFPCSTSSICSDSNVKTSNRH